MQCKSPTLQELAVSLGKLDLRPTGSQVSCPDPKGCRRILRRMPQVEFLRVLGWGGSESGAQKPQQLVEEHRNPELASV